MLGGLSGANHLWSGGDRPPSLEVFIVAIIPELLDQSDLPAGYRSQ